MLHKNAGVGDNHVIQHWEVADEAARLALVVTAADVGRVCRQMDTNVFWILNDDSPVTWLGPVGSPGPTGPAGAPGADGPTGPAGPAFTGGTLTSALNEAPIVTLPSAATVDIGAAAANSITISGTTTITSLGTIAAGARRLLRFSGILTLTHNATSLIIPGGASITTAAGDVAEMLSLGSGNWVCLAYTKANGTPIVGGGGGGLTNLAESKNTTAPNATVPAVILETVGTETNIDLVLLPKGTGAILVDIPNNAGSGGNKRGTGAKDFQMVRGGAGQVASGAESGIFAGNSHTASGTASAVLSGSGNTSSGNYSGVVTGASNSSQAPQSAVLAGNSNSTTGLNAGVVCGDSNQASGNNSVVLAGARGSTRGLDNSAIIAASYRANNYDAQLRSVVLRGITTNATSLSLTSTGTSANTASTPFLITGSSWYIKGKVVARSSGAETASWDVSALLRVVGSISTSTFVGTPSITMTFNTAGASAWTVAMTVDATGKITVDVTGAAATSIHWVAALELIEAVY